MDLCVYVRKLQPINQFTFRSPAINICSRFSVYCYIITWSMSLCVLWLHVWLFTNNLYELQKDHAVLQVAPEVCDGLQTWSSPQLGVHPGHIGCQLLLQSINQRPQTQTEPQTGTYADTHTHTQIGGARPWLNKVPLLCRARGGPSSNCCPLILTFPVDANHVLVSLRAIRTVGVTGTGPVRSRDSPVVRVTLERTRPPSRFNTFHLRQFNANLNVRFGLFIDFKLLNYSALSRAHHFVS